MSDRKYRQRGYQDADRDRQPKQGAPGQKPAPKERAPGRQLQDPSGPKTPNLMASHEVFRCARCGARLGLPVGADDRCPKCETALHACIQCASFDTSARFECSQTIAARVSPKDSTNTCALFTARTTVERQTSTQGPTTARQAFDDLFKF